MDRKTLTSQSLPAVDITCSRIVLTIDRRTSSPAAARKVTIRLRARAVNELARGPRQSLVLRCYDQQRPVSLQERHAPTR